MYITLSTFELQDAIRTQCHFSSVASVLLSHFFEDYEEETGERLEFNPTDIRCEFSEYSLKDLEDMYGEEASNEGYDNVISYVMDNTILIAETYEPDSKAVYVIRDF